MGCKATETSVFFQIIYSKAISEADVGLVLNSGVQSFMGSHLKGLKGCRNAHTFSISIQFKKQASINTRTHIVP